MKRDWFPWTAVAFLLVASLVVVGFVVARPSWFTGEGRDGAGGRTFSKDLADVGAADGVRLSDDNATSQAFTVPVPVDSRLGRPVLSLRGHTQVAASSTVFLRVLADGDSVYVSELKPGDHDLDVDVDLPRTAVEDGSVRVVVRTTGSLDQQRCNLTTELGALVVLDPDRTRVHGELDERPHTVRDVVAGLDHHVVLVLPPSADGERWFETAARLGAFLTQQGHTVTFADQVPDDGPRDRSPVLVGPAEALSDLGWDADGTRGSVRVGEHDGRSLLGVVRPGAGAVATFVTTSPVTAADTSTSDPQAEQLQRPTGERMSLEDLGADTTVQQVTDRRSWRVPYSLADLPGGTVPTAVRLGLLVPPTTDDARWLVQVRLDDELVDSVRLRETGRQTVTVDLPVARQRLRNELVVTLVRDRDVGGCHVRQTSYDVQLLADSFLVLGGEGAGFTAVPAQLATGFDVVVPPSSLQRPLHALAGLVPTLAELEGWRQDATFVWAEEPRDRAFLLLGAPPADLATPVTIAGGRLRAPGLNLSEPADGLVVQCVDGDGRRGVVVTAFGSPGQAVPDYGREVARVVTDGGGGFVVDQRGRVVSTPPARAESGE